MKNKFLAIWFLMASALHAQPIEFVVASAAGGPDDTISRKIVEVLETKTDLSIIVINKPGAAHKIGYSYVQQSNKPTLLLSTSEISHHEVIDSVDHIYNLGNFKNAVLVNSQSSIKSLFDLSKKSIVNFGSGGAGTFSYKAMEESCKSMNCIHVPYKGGSEGLLGLLSNTIDAYAIADYGNQVSSNEKYRVIGYVELKDNWVRLYSKNVSEADRKRITVTLKQQQFKL